MSRRLAVPFALALLAAPVVAQGGGFVAGDLYLLSPAVQGSSTSDGALVRVDLSAGLASMLIDTFATQSIQGNAALDPMHMWATDAAGNLDDLGLVDGVYGALAPVGDGRIYMSDQGGLGSSHPFVYLDASGALLTVMDAAGTQPFKVDGNGSFDVRGTKVRLIVLPDRAAQGLQEHRARAARSTGSTCTSCRSPWMASASSVRSPACSSR